MVGEIDLPEFDTDDAKEARHTPIDGPALVVTGSEQHTGYISDISPGDTPRLSTATPRII